MWTTEKCQLNLTGKEVRGRQPVLGGDGHEPVLREVDRLVDDAAGFQVQRSSCQVGTEIAVQCMRLTDIYVGGALTCRSCCPP